MPMVREEAMLVGHDRPTRRGDPTMAEGDEKEALQVVLREVATCVVRRAEAMG